MSASIEAKIDACTGYRRRREFIKKFALRCRQRKATAARTQEPPNSSATAATPTHACRSGRPHGRTPSHFRFGTAQERAGRWRKRLSGIVRDGWHPPGFNAPHGQRVLKGTKPHERRPATPVDDVTRVRHDIGELVSRTDAASFARSARRRRLLRIGPGGRGRSTPRRSRVSSGRLLDARDPGECASDRQRGSSVAGPSQQGPSHEPATEPRAKCSNACGREDDRAGNDSIAATRDIVTL
jgi:hypothetical protein